ncbi:MAG: efflux RND transporter periplasmic adaptor subunit [Verrucomicrobiota bacterium]
MKRKSIGTLLGLVASLALTSCQKQNAAGPPAGMAVSVVVVPAQRQPVSEKISLVGTLLANELVDVKSEIDGLVNKLGFEDGQPVKQGDLLVQLDDSKLAAAVAQAEANFQLSQANLKRQQELTERKVISRQEFDQAAAGYKVNEATLELKKRELKDTRIYAPYEGVMGARLVSPGQVISKNTAIGALVDLDPVKVEFNVPERFLGQLRTGQEVEIGLAAFPGEKFQGEVHFIAPQIDPNLRTATVRGRIANPTHRLKPGMFASLNLTLNVRPDAIVIPEIALVPQGDMSVVFVVDPESKAQIRPVQTGLRMNGQVEIVSGLNEGDQVIVEGFQKTRPGGPVKLAAAASTATPQKNRPGQTGR